MDESEYRRGYREGLMASSEAFMSAQDECPDDECRCCIRHEDRTRALLAQSPPAHDFDACPFPPDRCEPCREIFRSKRTAAQGSTSKWPHVLPTCSTCGRARLDAAAINCSNGFHRANPTFAEMVEMPAQQRYQCGTCGEYVATNDLSTPCPKCEPTPDPARAMADGVHIIRALAALLGASYADAAPTDKKADVMRELAAAARVEYDSLKGAARAMADCGHTRTVCPMCGDLEVPVVGSALDEARGQLLRCQSLLAAAKHEGLMDGCAAGERAMAERIVGRLRELAPRWRGVDTIAREFLPVLPAEKEPRRG